MRKNAAKAQAVLAQEQVQVQIQVSDLMKEMTSAPILVIQYGSVNPSPTSVMAFPPVLLRSPLPRNCFSVLFTYLLIHLLV